MSDVARDTRFKAGQPAWNKKPPIAKVCPRCGAGFSVKPSLARVKHCSRSCAQLGKPSPMRGRTASPETRAKQRAAKIGIRGEAHWNWRGASRSERKRAMARDEYVQWRSAVFQRDNFTCQFCGVRGVELHADHIQPWSTRPDLRFEVSNGRALCVPCHHSTPSFPKKLIPKEMRP
jgi:hypothetical protein